MWQTISYIILGIIGWIMLGSIILGGVDQENGNLEITNWKLHAVWWLRFLVNLLWPIISIIYLTRKRKG